MKKNVIALAVAAAMAAPLAAQAEVTVSGGLQLEVTSLSADDALLDNNGGPVTEGIAMHDAQEGGTLNSGTYSYIAFSASEDLGNGLKGIAKYAIDPNIDGGNGTIKNRDAYIGLSGGFGTVLAGRLSTPYKSSTASWDPFLATSGQARGNFGASTLHNGYADNVLAYANKFGPATVVLAAALDESLAVPADGSYNGEHTTTFSVNVPVGPVEVAVAYLNAAAVEDGTATKVGVKYAAGPIGVNFQYETIEAGLQNDLSGGLAVTDGETFMLVNGTYTMGANTFALSYGQNAQDYVGGSLDNTHTTAGVVHSFSKTTSVHAAYTALSVDGEADASGIALGMRVNF
jgi:predicted porin